MEYLELRKKVIKKYFGQMNDRQFEAVTTVSGPLLVLAGAGSGKTTVLVNRILNLVKFGDGFNSNYISDFTDNEIKIGEDYLNGLRDDIPDGCFSVFPSNPWQILAITFTNKAAGELKERIAAKLGDDANDIWAGTFHSICGKILRRNAEYLGYTSHFTIYDTDDQRRLMKEIYKQHNIDEKFVPYKSVLSAISSAKDKLISPEEYAQNVGIDYRQKIIADLYKIYQKKLKSADAMDFDDMIVNTVELLDKNEEVLEYYKNKFRYVLVDEYQDTNHAQYVLVSLLASGKNNICVVGDDDQSIYRFRGATIENILNFEENYRNAKTIRLEQNYRSTSNILNAANSVIANNKGRKGKTLWTDNGDGEKLKLYTAEDEREEARFVADGILENVRNGAKFSDHAVLYRMNAQSNALENVFMRSGISYKIIGGTRFYDRKEIKDVLAYLQLINNNNDDLRLRRIINEPKRGIGDTTVNRAGEISAQLDISLFELFKSADEYAVLSRASGKIKQFIELIENLTEKSEELSISELFEEMLDKTGYLIALKAEGEEAQDRVDNVMEFSSTIAQYELETEEPSLSDFLEQISLISDIDSFDTEQDKVVLMTVHSAKGLEFKNVFLIGMEEGIFPGNQSIYSGPEEIEEERRLAYVAITRAKQKLTVTNSFSRMIFGQTTRNMPSRFVNEIPDEYVESSSAYSPYKKIAITEKTYITKVSGFTNSFTSSSSQKSNTNAEKTEYTVGMQVSHKTFGTGIILSVTKMSNDTMLEIAFDKVGTKKIMANFAKLTF
ncbi:MAG: UvrD-helicase domain-containing protein [Clostridia bacterium]|nr:UvrD-helicase domain-containing protein [Clostridia bacterium]